MGLLFSPPMYVHLELVAGKFYSYPRNNIGVSVSYGRPRDNSTLVYNTEIQHGEREKSF